MNTSAASARQDDRLALLTVPAPLLALERVAQVAVEDGVLYWDPPAHDSDGWSFVGGGEAVRIEATGEGRFGVLKQAADGIWARLHERSASLPGPVPSPRLFGGFSFIAHPTAGPWQDFGQASFTLPQWVYGRRGDQAFLRVAVPPNQGVDVKSLLWRLEARQDAQPDPAPARAYLEELGLEEWTGRITAALTDIRAGRFEKVVAARRSCLVAEREIDVAAVLGPLRRGNPEATRFAFTRGESAFLGATPEHLVIRRGAYVECDALAGSRAKATGDDTAGAQALLASEKDRREHAPVVTEIRARLSPLCSQIDAPVVPHVRTLRTVHHLWTPVVARLAGPTHVLDLVQALHPTPAVSGRPRDAALEWIAAHEPEGRGWYAGPVGWFDAEGNGTFCVAIRSALVRGREAWLHAGGGIVQGSDPVSEYQETALKQSTMLNVLGVGL